MPTPPPTVMSHRYARPGDLGYIQQFWQEQVSWVDAHWPDKPFTISETGAGGVYEWTNASDPRWSQGYEAEVVIRDASFAVDNANVSGAWWRACVYEAWRAHGCYGVVLPRPSTRACARWLQRCLCRRWRLAWGDPRVCPPPCHCPSPCLAQASPCGSSTTSRPTPRTRPSAAAVCTCPTRRRWPTRGPAATSTSRVVGPVVRTTRGKSTSGAAPKRASRHCGACMRHPQRQIRQVGRRCSYSSSHERVGVY